VTRSPTALEILELLSTRARYREWLTGGHREADHGMVADNLSRVTAQIEALTHRQVAEALEQLRAQPEPAAAWTAAELEDLRLLAWALGPENDGQLTITSGRALTDTLSIAKMADPDPGRGRLLPELEALMSVSVSEWLLIQRALNALLGQATPALPEPEASAAAPTAGEEPETLLERNDAQQEQRRQEIAALSPGLRQDLELLAVLASEPDAWRGVTESRAREILACTVPEYRQLIRRVDAEFTWQADQS
jgi:hypothetical protein